jgi:hypothetical protein
MVGGTLDDLTAPQEWVAASTNSLRCVLHRDLQQPLLGSTTVGESEVDEPGDGGRKVCRGRSTRCRALKHTTRANTQLPQPRQRNHARGIGMCDACTADQLH